LAGYGKIIPIGLGFFFNIDFTSRGGMRTVIFMLILLLSAISGNAEQDIPSLVKKVQPAVVSIITYDIKGNKFEQGSGFFINQSGKIITNWHVIKDASSATIKTATGAMFQVKGLVAKDKKKDLAIVILDAKDISFPFLSMSSVTPNVGERIFVVGSPYGLDATVSDGLVSAMRELPDAGNILQISAPISSGSSGSPVINLNGQVVGVASFQFIEGQNLNFAISSDEVIKLSKMTQNSITPLNLALSESKGYSHHINPEVQLKDNGWIRIVDESVKESETDTYKNNIRFLFVKVQFLKPCKASYKSANDDYGRKCVDIALKYLKENRMLELMFGTPELNKKCPDVKEYITERFRCNYRNKVFVSFYSSGGKEIETVDAFPLPIEVKVGGKIKEYKTEALPGEKTKIPFEIPIEATSWYVWVPK
jgi:hypothetical protein